MWTADGAYVSVLRLEPYVDGYLLTGLETAPAARGKGYATMLMRAMLDIFPERIYSHVQMKNTASLALHQNVGFKILYDYAHLLDGTVSRNYYTLVVH